MPGARDALALALAAAEQSEERTTFDYIDWRPDISAFPAPRKSPYLVTAQNVLPAADGYKPAPGFAATSEALGAEMFGGAAFVNKSGEPVTIVGDATGLNRLLATGAWEDVTRASLGAYALGDEEVWTFGQFGDNIIAHHIDDDVQIYDMTSSSDFSAVSGDPPNARYGCSFSSQYVLMNTENSQAELYACRVNDIDSWDGDGTGGSWKFTCPDGGPVNGGYEAYGALWVAQADKWRRFTFVGDEFTIDQDVVSTRSGVDVPNSLVTYRGHAFYVGGDGLYQFSPLGEGPINIGVGKVDEFFLNDFSRGHRHLVSSAIDPRAKLWMLAYSSNGSATDRVLTYYWPDKRFSVLAVEVAQLFSAYSLGIAWDDLDDLYATVDDIDLPFDSPAFVGGALLLGVLSTDQKFGVFGGSSLAARLESGDHMFGPDHSAMIKKVSGVCDLADPTDMSVTIGRREHPGGTISYGSAETCNSQMEAFPNRFARFPRIRTEIAAGADWSKIRGVEVIWQSGGRR